ncbi:response regulator transcription factor [Gehongia tenuis]|uniref:Stage 0 sporulation protein A homolog n=1 Tax=Gehongia tenuis TaxID=2763655 RepID=A0A926D4L3_9FIRM|nr:response regulator transcription factor [Gehongia tenuis]MBC8531252.1 response regulator transcription factor [Gehongia tenuis]
MNKLLLVEDDQTIALGLEYSLKQEGFSVKVCHDLATAQQAIREPFALAILDLSLPDGSGYDLCRQIKATGDMPVIFLTANDDEVSVVMGLDMGADDYITKPFRIRELVSRIKTVLRRYGKGKDESSLEVGPIRINTAQAKVYKADREILLTALEYRLLLILATNGGQVLSRSQILEGIWDVGSDFVNDNTLTVYIKRLREKIEDDPQNPEIIRTVRGLGYQMAEVRT